MRMWLEILFDVAYLIAIWSLVVAMIRHASQVAPEDRRVSRWFIWAFGLLAFGDTGHVGFRVVAYALGDLGATFTLLGVRLGLVGLGSLSTAITLTLFYGVLLAIWQARSGKPYGWCGLFLFAMIPVRFGLMALPQNTWNEVVPPQPWVTYRNIPLFVHGLGVAYLMLRDARASDDRLFAWVGAMILVSYAFYTPVVLWVQVVPPLGMLMIPKTLAYIAIAALAYKRLFRAEPSRRSVS